MRVDFIRNEKKKMNKNRLMSCFKKTEDGDKEMITFNLRWLVKVKTSIYHSRFVSFES